jgi:hypothetical protein
MGPERDPDCLRTLTQAAPRLHMRQHEEGGRHSGQVKGWRTQVTLASRGARRVPVYISPYATLLSSASGPMLSPSEPKMLLRSLGFLGGW